MDNTLFIFNPNTMPNGRRKFTDEQKLEILRQAEQIGINKALRHHSLSYSVFSRWREKFSSNDEHKQEAMMRNKAKWELKQYIEENARLKKNNCLPGARTGAQRRRVEKKQFHLW